MGRNFTKSVVDCLWYIDSHHSTLHSQSCPVPPLFQCFVGYNTPELSKHRKRQYTNMSSSMLSTLASSRFQNIQESFWSRESLHELHSQTRSLARSMAEYADYLTSQNKTMKGLHVRTCPVRQLSESLSAKYIGRCNGDMHSKLVALFGCLQERGDSEYVELHEFTPDQPRRKYDFIQCLERNGLPVPIMLLTYSSGNNAGNLHFV